MIAQGFRRSPTERWFASGGRKEVQEAEDDEEDRQADGQAEESPLDAATAAIGGHLAAEGAAKAGSTLLEQDRGDEGDGQDSLGDDKWTHGRGVYQRVAAAGFGARSRIRLRPVIDGEA